MALCWPGLILLIFAFSTPARAGFTLTAELTHFIPSCAQECFSSFLDSNFLTSTCTNTPTLDCLCSHNSTSGYTVGEGALQCIISEGNIGFCSGNDASQSTILAAFGMCNGEANALPNTHATITATLIIESSMPSIVLVAPPPTSTSNLSTTGTLSKTTSIASLLTASESPPQITAATTSYSAVAASKTPTASSTLSKTQITGIVVASVGGAAFAIGSLVLFACLRRRRQRARDSDLFPFQSDPSNLMLNGSKYRTDFKVPQEMRGVKGPGGTVDGLAAKMPPRVPPRLETSSPNMFSRRSIRPDVIGLAISPERPIAVEKPQRQSKLLPEKPTLTLKMPQPGERQVGGLAFSQPIINQSAVSRQSTATQFEEDIESADTAVGADDGWGRSIDQVKYANGNLQTIRPIYPNPAAAPTFYPSEDGGLWRPGQAQKPMTTSPESYVMPLTIGSKVGSFSQPRRPEAFSRSQQQQLGVPPQPRPVTGSSSIYSQPSRPPSDVARHSMSRARQSYQQRGPYDHQSLNSSTSLESGEPIPSPQDQELKTAEALSPVVESPSSGRSPVSYPKIPKRLSPETIRLVPPPPQPDFTRAFGGVAATVPPWRQAEIDAQRERERQAQARAEYQQDQAQAQTMLRPPPRSHARQSSREKITINYSPPPVPLRLQTQLTDATGGWGWGTPSTSTTYLPPPLPISASQPKVSEALKPLTSHPSITFTRSSSTVSQFSQRSVGTQNSTSSSLLAKRRGEQKAQALALKAKEQKEGEDKKKWRVLKKDEIESAKKGGWRPMTGRDGGGGRELVVDGEQLFERTDLPSTPGWVPKLTPTRRGDELFLSVQ